MNKCHHFAYAFWSTRHLSSSCNIPAHFVKETPPPLALGFWDRAKTCCLFLQQTGPWNSTSRMQTHLYNANRINALHHSCSSRPSLTLSDFPSSTLHFFLNQRGSQGSPEKKTLLPVKKALCLHNSGRRWSWTLSPESDPSTTTY